MSAVQSIAEEVRAFLGTSRVRLASDAGLIAFRVIGGVLVADLDGATYEVTIAVRRVTP